MENDDKYLKFKITAVFVALVVCHFVMLGIFVYNIYEFVNNKRSLISFLVSLAFNSYVIGVWFVKDKQMYDDYRDEKKLCNDCKGNVK